MIIKYETKKESDYLLGEMVKMTKAGIRFTIKPSKKFILSNKGDKK